MKIITTTAEDFFRAEVDEHGWDYVDAQFARGYEPTLVNGIWVWRRNNTGSQHIFGSGTSTHSGNTASTTNRRNSVLA